MEHPETAWSTATNIRLRARELPAVCFVISLYAWCHKSHCPDNQRRSTITLGSRTRSEFPAISKTMRVGIQILFLIAECVDKVDEGKQACVLILRRDKHTARVFPCQLRSNFCLKDGETCNERL